MRIERLICYILGHKWTPATGQNCLPYQCRRCGIWRYHVIERLTIGKGMISSFGPRPIMMRPEHYRKTYEAIFKMIEFKEKQPFTKPFEVDTSA